MEVVSNHNSDLFNIVTILDNITTTVTKAKIDDKYK